METLPKLIGFENVVGLLQDQFKDGYKWFKDELKSLGYKFNQYVLNAKFYGLPHNRDRIFLCALKEIMLYPHLNIKN